MDEATADTVKTWRTAHGDMTDEEWELIAGFFPTWTSEGTLGRPAKWAKRDVVNAIFYVLATGCQWRALPEQYPHWNTVHRYHRQWSQDGTWERVGEFLTGLAREAEGRDLEPTAGAIDARSVRGAATVTGESRGYDGGKKISGRKTVGVVDTCGFLLAVAVVAASVSDNAGGIIVMERVRERRKRFELVWCDRGFKVAFARFCRSIGVRIAVIQPRPDAEGFEVQPRRWVVERTWSWIMNQRRLQVDYERDPVTTEGFVWAANSRLLLRRLTESGESL